MAALLTLLNSLLLGAPVLTLAVSIRFLFCQQIFGLDNYNAEKPAKCLHRKSGKFAYKQIRELGIPRSSFTGGRERDQKESVQGLWFICFLPLKESWFVKYDTQLQLCIISQNVILNFLYLKKM